MGMTGIVTSWMVSLVAASMKIVQTYPSTLPITEAMIGTGPVRICFRPLEQQATKAAFLGAGIIRRIKFLFGHRHSPVKNGAGLMKQSGSVQMKRNDAPAAMENRLGTNAHLPVYLSSI